MKKLITLLMLVPIFCSAQKQGNIWYFGGDYNNQSQFGAGIDFNPATPTAITNSGMRHTEGCATYCNSAGELLFYAQGDTVYDRTHNVMLNGGGLGGHWSTEQSALIVPVTGDTNKYYIFNNDGLLTSNGTGLHYSVIDMQQNGGMGAVVEPKAKNLISNNSEQLTGCIHSNGADFWVITTDYDSSIFYAYQVTASGVLPPVVTDLGFTGFASTSGHTIGNIEISPNGDKIATKLRNVNVNSLMCYLVDFDNATGIFSNPYPLGNPNGYNSACGFSPNGNLFYSIERTLATDSLFQFDLTAANIDASKLYIYSRPFKYQFDSKLGPDGKLYFSGTYTSTSLDVINFPDLLGVACNFQPNAISLGGQNSGYMLPNELLIAPIFATGIDDYDSENSLSIYPNPANNAFTITTKQSIFKANDQLQLFSITGQLLYASAINAQQTSVDISNLPQGTYMLRTNLNGIQQSFKILKE